MGHPPNIMSFDPKRFPLAILAAMLCAPGSWAAGADESGPILNQATVEQDPGKTVYWVLPGPRKLSEGAAALPRA